MTSSYKVSNEAFNPLLMELIICTFLRPSLVEDQKNTQVLEKSVELFCEAMHLGIQGSQNKLWYMFPSLQKVAPNWSGFDKGEIKIFGVIFLFYS